MKRLPTRLRRDASGLALIEFAITLPVLLTLALTGAELTNFITVKMRMSQIALQVADNAARMGTSVAYGARQVSEADINDVFVGSQLQSNGLNIGTNGRIILSDLEPTAAGATTYKIGWQRCYGTKTDHASTYGTVASGPKPGPGMGPVGNQATAMDGSATMYVEVYYEYKPLINIQFVKDLNLGSTLTEIASMAVRDNRDLTDDSKNADGSTNANPKHPNGVYKVDGVTPSTC